MGPALLVIAKAPVPGRVKTRLTPPCTPEQAAALARAALHGHPRRRGRRARRRPPRRSCSTASRARGCPPASRSSPSAVTACERLAAAFEDVGEPAFLVGMDTPQVTPELLDAGPARGGRRRLGVRRRARRRLLGHRPAHAGRRAVFAGVPMSTRAHRRRPARPDARRSACTPAILPPLRDVDTFDDALRRRRRGAGHALRRRAGRDRRRTLTRLRMTVARRRATRRSGPPSASRCPPTRSTGACSPRAAQHLDGAGPPPQARHPARRRARSSRCRSTAGSRPPTRPTRRSSPTSRRRCSTSAAARAAISRALRALGKRGLGVDLSPVAVAARARARRRRRSTARCGRRCPAPGLADDPAAGRQHRHRRRARSRCCGAPASCSRPAARSSSRPTRRARRRTRVRVRIEAPDVVSEWFRWARVGADGAAAVAERGGVRGRGQSASSSGRTFVTLRRL